MATRQAVFGNQATNSNSRFLFKREMYVYVTWELLSLVFEDGSKWLKSNFFHESGRSLNSVSRLLTNQDEEGVVTIPVQFCFIAFWTLFLTTPKTLGFGELPPKPILANTIKMANDTKKRKMTGGTYFFKKLKYMFSLCCFNNCFRTHSGQVFDQMKIVSSIRSH
jgi:hypothetical protein